MKTRLHYYAFHLSDKDEAAAWTALREKLIADGYGPGKMHSHGGKQAPMRNETIDVDVETAHIFDNQWNTAEPHNARVFDWFQQYETNGAKLARGHWLEITPEMLGLREQTFVCGYCGKLHGPKHADIPEKGFCESCLDSVYLKESDLNLLRLVKVAARHHDSQTDEHITLRGPLTADERAWLLLAYVARQTSGNDSRAKARRDKELVNLEKEYENTIATAKTEHDGKRWLWEKGWPLSNVIFYDHVGQFCFGWQNPIQGEVKTKLEALLIDFPFSYTIQTEKKY